MGSIAQEMGHDLTIMYFIDKVLKPMKEKDDFFIIHPAIGPERDIHYWNPLHKPPEYTSGWDTSRNKFIPEYFYRRKFPGGVIGKLNKVSRYWEERWYSSLTKKLGTDLKDFSDGLCCSIEEIMAKDYSKVDKLPDFIGIRDGKISNIGEIKFEYLPKRAMNEFLAYNQTAQTFEVPFFLVFPKKGFYSSTDYSWIKKNLPRGIEFFTLESEGQEGKRGAPILIPNYKTIKFDKWNPK